MVESIISFPSLWLWVTALVDGLALGLALYTAPWFALRSTKALQHLFFGAAVALVLLWSLRAGLSSGLSVHFLGMTSATLLFGWNLGLVAGALALFGTTVIGLEAWQVLPVNLLCFVVIPVIFTHLLWCLVEWKLPKNFFIYLLLCGFLGGGLAAVAGGLSMALLLGFAEIYSWGRIFDEYVRYLPLILFPEGFLNGVIMTSFMVYYPDWVRTFDARRYLDGQ